MRASTLRISKDNEDFIVEVVKIVRVPAAAVMAEANPAASLITAAKANLSTALDGADAEVADQLEFLAGGMEKDIHKRVKQSIKDFPADGKERDMF